MLHALSCVLLLTADAVMAIHEAAQEMHPDVDHELLPELSLQVDTHQRKLLGEILLFVQEPTFDAVNGFALLPVQINADGTVGDIAHAVYKRHIAGAQVVCQGQVLALEQLLADSGLSSEALVEVRLVPTDCMLLTLAFNESSVFELHELGWRRIETNVEPQDCCAFKGVECFDGQALSPIIKHVELAEEGLSGNITWNNLPRSLRSLNLDGNEFDGEVTWYDLPRSLELLELGGNSFNGYNLPWHYFPRSLVVLDLGGNNFAGDVAWSDLPRSLEDLDLSDGTFCGELNASALPRELENLQLGDNQFGGAIGWQHLPRLLETLDLADNNFEGDMTCLWKDLPQSLWSLFLCRNHFEGSISWQDLPGSLVDLGISGNELNVTEEEIANAVLVIQAARDDECFAVN